jgi:hypothetical protein
MGDLLGSFPVSVRVRTKHAEKTRVSLWVSRQCLNRLGCYKWYQSRPLPVRCGSGTNQAEAGGHVTPAGGHVTSTADESRRVIANDMCCVGRILDGAALKGVS